MTKFYCGQVRRINKALYDLEDILASIGVKEFSISKERHNVQIDTNNGNIDTDLLNTFCKKIQLIHDAKFGPGSLAA